MVRDLILILTSIGACAAIGALMFLRARSIADGVPVSKLIASYKLEIVGGKLECDLTLVDGRVVSFALDPAIVYDLSNALLAAATRMGARRQGVVEVEPDAMKPSQGMKS